MDTDGEARCGQRNTRTSNKTRCFGESPNQDQGLNVEINLQMSHHTDASMSAPSAQSRASTAYVKFVTESHIPMATAAMLRARRYQIRGTRLSAAEMKDRTGISEYITTIQQGPRRNEGGIEKWQLPSRWGIMLKSPPAQRDLDAGIQE